jgi:hypothetical protein
MQGKEKAGSFDPAFSFFAAQYGFLLPCPLLLVEYSYES